jgi:hypothetical protein
MLDGAGVVFFCFVGYKSCCTWRISKRTTVLKRSNKVLTLVTSKIFKMAEKFKMADFEFLPVLTSGDSVTKERIRTYPFVKM